MKESPARGFVGDAGAFGGLQQAGAHFLHPDAAQELHGSAAALPAERMLQGSRIDPGGLADVAQREWQMGVGAHVLLGGVELPDTGLRLTVDQPGVVVRLGLQQQDDNLVLELAQGS